MPDPYYLSPYPASDSTFGFNYNEFKERLRVAGRAIEEINKGLQVMRQLKKDLEKAKKVLIQSKAPPTGKYENSLEWYDDMIDEMTGAICLTKERMEDVEGAWRDYIKTHGDKA